MNVAYQSGIDYIKSYSGFLKIFEAVLNVTTIIATTLLGATYQAEFLCGLCIYGFVSSMVLLALHVRGIVKYSDFPWFWVECINCSTLVLLLGISSSLVLSVLSKGHILTGIIGYIAVLVYALDTVEKYNLARTPRARYVWTTPNMPV